MNTIEDRAAEVTKEILTYFKNLEALGRFSNEDVHEQKHCYLMMELINFSRREETNAAFSCLALNEAIEQIRHWIEAYPLYAFPEPDMKKARELLEAGGMSLGAVSVSNMRHVLRGVSEIINEYVGRHGDD